MQRNNLNRTRRPGAVFFDRDGCLNHDSGFLHRWQDFRWLPGAVEAIRMANQAGFRVFVVTNQSGIARGYYSAEDVCLLHSQMAADLAARGAWIDAFRFCPHHPEFGAGGPCLCRKPAPGMVRDLLKAWNIPRDRAIMVGDRATDVAAAEAAGICGLQISPGGVLPAVRRELARLRHESLAAARHAGGTP